MIRRLFGSLPGLMNVYMFRQPGQQKDWPAPFFEAGIALSLVALALFVAASLAGRIRAAD